MLLLRSSTIFSQLNESTAHEIHTLISQTADAYQDASQLSPESTSAAYHARFLRSLVTNDVFTTRRKDQKEMPDSGMPIDPRLQREMPMFCFTRRLLNASTEPPTQVSVQSTTQIYTHPHPPPHPHEQFQFPASPHLPAHPPAVIQEPVYAETISRNPPMPVGAPVPMHYPGYAPQAPQYASELDAHYWKNMFIELGFGENGEGQAMVPHDGRGVPQYMEQVHHHLPPHHVHHQHSGHLIYQHQHQQHLHQSSQATNYGH
ncbi:hypothetical protein H0H81_000939 [Sphagnurus paluster]|uniref:Uncharacterized protein n=1 Tax=Sphagnurus paluster TaxID=117069 RepID=A0A9P7FPS6_9AGAR|nr:hypothetical protein H0H81_000939 [Sphagnurus paluster]